MWIHSETRTWHGKNIQSEDLITIAEQKEKETVEKVKKERSSYTFEPKLKALKDLNHEQLAACDVADKLEFINLY